MYIKVRFIEGTTTKLYDYKTLVEVEVGDLVVVEARDSYGLAEVIQVNSSKGAASKYAICKVDLKTIAKQKEIDEKIVETKRKLEERKKVFEEKQMWIWLAKEDKEASILLDELNKLGGL